MIPFETNLPEACLEASKREHALRVHVNFPMLFYGAYASQGNGNHYIWRIMTVFLVLIQQWSRGAHVYTTVSHKVFWEKAQHMHLDHSTSHLAPSSAV